jgi:hypothetical protein
MATERVAPGIPPELCGPVDVELARAVEPIPGPNALPGGTSGNPCWTAIFTELVKPGLA